MAAVEPLVLATNERHEPLVSLTIQCVDYSTGRVLMTARTNKEGMASFSNIDAERRYFFRPESNRNQSSDGWYGNIHLVERKKSPSDPDTVPPVTTQDADQTEPVAITYLVFTTAPEAVDAGVATGTITVERRDVANELLTEGALTVYLYSTSSGGVFSTGATATIADGDSSVSFTYTDDTTGNPVLTASTEALT